MPIYEYECTSCGHRFEKMVRISAEPPPCPACAQVTRKLISQSSFILKGGGWYKDHYGLKKDGGGKDSGSDAPKSEAPKTEAPKAEPKADAKPAAPTPAATK